MTLKNYEKYVNLAIDNYLIEEYLKKNLNIFISCKSMVVEQNLIIKVCLNKLVLKIPEQDLHVENISKFTNFKKSDIIIEPIYLQNYKKDLTYLLDTFIKYTNNNIYSNVPLELNKLSYKLINIGVKGFILTLSGKITGARHKTIKMKQGVMKYTGTDADKAILNLKYQIHRPSGTLGLVVKLLKPRHNIPGKIIYKKI